MPTDPDKIRQQLLTDIELAFAGVQRGDGPTLREADLEGAGSDEQRRAARSRDTDSTWQEIPEQSIVWFFSALSFLAPQGFRYYAPAFMSFALKHYADSDSPAVDWIIYSFAYFGDAEREWSNERFLQFDANQSATICRFLRFIVDHTHGAADETVAEKALQDYWGRFCAPEAS